MDKTSNFVKEKQAEMRSLVEITPSAQPSNGSSRCKAHVDANIGLL
jgi:hypothetical protein